VHIYNEDEIDELLIMIRDSFIPAFEKLRQTLSEKLEEMADEPV